MPTASSSADFSPKSQDAVALQRIKERGALPMIDRGDITVGQSTVTLISGLHCRALVMVSFDAGPDSLIGDSEAGRDGRKLMYEAGLPIISRSGYHRRRLPVMDG